MIGTRFTLAGALAALALTLASCGGSSDSSGPATEAASPGPVPEISLHAVTHHPKVGEAWPISIRAFTAGGRPLRAEVRYQYLFGGAVVARRSHYRFRGTFHDAFHWPARSVGVPLTFRAVVTTPLGTRRLDYRVEVEE